MIIGDTYSCQCEDFRKTRGSCLLKQIPKMSDELKLFQLRTLGISMYSEDD